LFFFYCSISKNIYEPEKTKKAIRLPSSFRVRLSSYFADTLIKNQFSPLQNRPLPQCERRLFSFSVKFDWNTSKRRRKSKKEVYLLKTHFATCFRRVGSEGTTGSTQVGLFLIIALFLSRELLDPRNSFEIHFSNVLDPLFICRAGHPSARIF